MKKSLACVYFAMVILYLCLNACIALAEHDKWKNIHSSDDNCV